MKLLMAIFFMIVLAASGLFIHGVDEKRRADLQPDSSWIAKFWEKEKNNLAGWKTKAYLELTVADKAELILWLDSRWRKERLSNQNNEEKLDLRMALGAISSDIENRKYYAKFKDLSGHDKSKFMARLDKDKALLCREWMTGELQRISNDSIAE